MAPEMVAGDAASVDARTDVYLLGATLQRKGHLTNNGVNLLATLFGAVVGAFFWGILKII